MTKKQMEILDIVLDNPNCSRRELALLLKQKSIGSLHKHLTALRDAGLVTWERYKSRTLRAHGRILKAGCVTGYIVKIHEDVYWIGV